MCAMLTAEERECCEDKLENLHTLYDRGAKLTKTGIEFVEEMQRLVVIIDVSHLIRCRIL